MAIDLIRDAASTLEEYNQAAQPDFDRWLLWALNWFARSLNDMAVGSLKAFLEEALENATTYQKEEMAIEIHLSITEFSVVVTKQFERGPPEAKMTPDDWKKLEPCRSGAASRIQKASQGVAISIRQANEQVQKQALLSRQVTLALDTTGDSDEAVVPCLSLPRPSDSRFFDRTEIIQEIDSRLQRFEPEREFCSLALHGLGGVGKSEIALQYVHSRSKEYDAVLWVLSENLNDLETNFTDLCLKLGLKGADKNNNTINKVILKTRLQKTSSSGIQVEVFNPVLGSQLLFSVLQRVGTQEDTEAAQALADSTGGLPLALFNVAGLIQSKNFSIAKVVQMYEKHRHQVHRTSQDGRTIETV
ncbi:hypothetical protein B0T24DRAFT_684738 [Lasiosphaeria ovina]|uniref:NB-ARC domain-containing protein n=1 Tax=Lasiosphaeria ovina TaxID=92902 RepID=A0AAE0MZU2_9PEZI|nr:hypothetical protein B0T24DRAFT_684738 [Lasiosphaeria ovina]